MEFLLFNYSRTAPGHDCHLQQQSSLQSSDRAGRDPVSVIVESGRGVELNLDSLFCLSLSSSIQSSHFRAWPIQLSNLIQMWNRQERSEEKTRHTVRYQQHFCQCEALRAGSNKLKVKQKADIWFGVDDRNVSKSKILHKLNHAWNRKAHLFCYLTLFQTGMNVFLQCITKE